MPRCEDYPCCGHGDGECPNSDGTFNCSQCGRKLAKNASSSICPKCMRRGRFDDPYGDHDHSMDY